MWWFGVWCHMRVSPSSIFCEQGAKMHAVNYQTDILETIVKLLNNTLFVGSHWIFQQDTVSAYKAKTTQWWLETNLPEFIPAEDWPSGSSDLNPLDYHLWNILEEKACCTSHHSTETFKGDLVTSAASIPLDVMTSGLAVWGSLWRQRMGILSSSIFLYSVWSLINIFCSLNCLSSIFSILDMPL